MADFQKKNHFKKKKLTKNTIHKRFIFLIFLHFYMNFFIAKYWFLEVLHDHRTFYVLVERHRIYGTIHRLFPYCLSC